MSNFLKTLGPGILFASTAIGVSHLVQSTRAGAVYGFALLGFVIAANLFKYPFFEFGSRYAAATKTSLIDGYKKLSPWILAMYFVITLCSMFFVMAAVAFVTAGFMENLFGLQIASKYNYVSSLVLLIICCLVLGLGKYHILDNLIKVIAVVLLLSTMAAFILVLFNGPVMPAANFFNFNLIDKNSLPFIIALMGWMPTAVDLSTWNSLWTLERAKDSGYEPSVKETVFEFNLGYFISAILSICFITLGAFMLFGTGEVMPGNKAAFAANVVSMYADTFGSWSYFIIAAAAFSIMFSTSIAVLDGYARAMSRTISLFQSNDNEPIKKSNYVLWLLVTAIGGFAIISLFLEKLTTLVDLATTISFLIAPIIAIINLKLVTGDHLKQEDKPGKTMRWLSYVGILFLSAFSIYFIFIQFTA